MKTLMIITAFYSHSMSVATETFSSIRACEQAVMIVRGAVGKTYESYDFFGSSMPQKNLQIVCVETPQ